MSNYLQRLAREVDDYSKSIRHGMVAERDTLQEVQDYCMQFNAQERIIALTVFHMTLNTVANNLNNMPKTTDEEG